MSSKTRIVVLHMKEMIYTAIFAGLGVLLVLLLCWMFQQQKNEEEVTETIYLPGVYTAGFTLEGSSFAVEVVVDENHINDISFVNLEESVSVLYPLMEPAMEEIAAQIYATQSLEDITFSSDKEYTSQVLLSAIQNALSAASP